MGPEEVGEPWARQVEGRLSLLVPRIEVCAAGEEEVYRSPLVHEHGDVEGGVAIVVAQIGVGPNVQEDLHRLHFLRRDRGAQGACIGVSTVLEQHTHDCVPIGAMALYSTAEGRLSPMCGICATLEEQGHHLGRGIICRL